MIDLATGALTLDDGAGGQWRVDSATTLDAFLRTPIGQRSTSVPPFPGRTSLRTPPAAIGGLVVIPTLQFAGQRLIEVDLFRASEATGWEDFSEKELLRQYQQTQAWLIAQGWKAERRLPWGTVDCLLDRKTPSVALVVTYRQPPGR